MNGTILFSIFSIIFSFIPEPFFWIDNIFTALISLFRNFSEDGLVICSSTRFFYSKHWSFIIIIRNRSIVETIFVCVWTEYCLITMSIIIALIIKLVNILKLFKILILIKIWLLVIILILIMISIIILKLIKFCFHYCSGIYYVPRKVYLFA